MVKASSTSLTLPVLAVLVLVGAGVVLLGPQLTGYQFQINENQNQIQQIQQNPGSSSFQELRISLENMSIDIDGASRQFTVLKFESAVPNSLGLFGFGSLGNYTQLYLVLLNRSSNAFDYPGKILYQTSTGQWNSVSIGAGRSESSSANFSGTMHSVNLDSLNPIRYYTRSTTPARPTSVVLSIEDFGITLTPQFLSSFRGKLILNDGYNSATDRGGFWVIPVSSTNGLGVLEEGRYSGLNLNRQMPRSLQFYYYYRVAGMTTDESAFPSFDENSHNYYVKPFFGSPAVVELRILQRNRVYLTEDQNSHSNIFDFRCVDSDTNNNLGVRGRISMNNSGVMFTPYAAHDVYDTQDQQIPSPRCERGRLGLNVLSARLSLRPATVPIQVNCNSQQMPVNDEAIGMGLGISHACPNIACNAAHSNCAAATVRFNCQNLTGGGYPGVNVTVAGDFWVVSTGSDISGHRFQPRCTSATATGRPPVILIDRGT